MGLYLWLQTPLASCITSCVWSRPTNKCSDDKKRWPDILQHVIREQFSGSTWWVYDSVQQEHIWSCSRWTSPGNSNDVMYSVLVSDICYTVNELISCFNQVPLLQPGTSASILLPMVLFQNISPGPPSSLLQVAVKNNQQPVWYFNDKISLAALFAEDGRMERTAFLEVRVFESVYSV